MSTNNLRHSTRPIAVEHSQGVLCLFAAISMPISALIHLFTSPWPSDKTAFLRLREFFFLFVLVLFSIIIILCNFLSYRFLWCNDLVSYHIFLWILVCFYSYFLNKSFLVLVLVISNQIKTTWLGFIFLMILERNVP